MENNLFISIFSFFFQPYLLWLSVEVLWCSICQECPTKVMNSYPSLLVWKPCQFQHGFGPTAKSKDKNHINQLLLIQRNNLTTDQDVQGDILGDVWAQALMREYLIHFVSITHGTIISITRITTVTTIFTTRITTDFWLIITMMFLILDLKLTHELK